MPKLGQTIKPRSSGGSGGDGRWFYSDCGGVQVDDVPDGAFYILWTYDTGTPTLAGTAASFIYRLSSADEDVFIIKISTGGTMHVGDIGSSNRMLLHELGGAFDDQHNCA